jgi:3-oxoadipate enol-lactonase
LTPAAGRAGAPPTGQPGIPPVPPGRRLPLPGRGTTFIREASPPGVGPVGAGPALVLLHGWTVTSDLNWYGLYGPLARRFRLVAIDLRGHGRGLRTDEPFTLERCADDVLAVIDELGLGRVVPVGYSMGGLVAQLVWRRGRERVAGLVLAATAPSFSGTVGDRLYFGGLAALVRAYALAPTAVRDQAVNRYLTARTGRLEPWAAAEVASGDMRAYLEAGRAIGTFSSHAWLGSIDVPCAVVVTMRDRTVPTWRQRDLAATIPRARTFPVDGDHQVVARQPERIAGALLAACEWVRDEVVPRAGAAG